MIVRIAQEADGLVIETVGHDGPPLTLVLSEAVTARLPDQTTASNPRSNVIKPHWRRPLHALGYTGVFVVAAMFGMAISGTKSDANALGHRFPPDALSAPLAAPNGLSPASRGSAFTAPAQPQAAQRTGSAVAATPSSASAMPPGIAKALATRPVFSPGTDGSQPLPEAEPSAAPPVQHANPASLFGLQP